MYEAGSRPIGGRWFYRTRGGGAVITSRQPTAFLCSSAGRTTLDEPTKHQPTPPRAILQDTTLAGAPHSTSPPPSCALLQDGPFAGASIRHHSTPPYPLLLHLALAAHPHHTSPPSPPPHPPVRSSSRVECHISTSALRIAVRLPTYTKLQRYNHTYGCWRENKNVADMSCRL